MKLVINVFFNEFTLLVNSGFFYLKRRTVEEIKAICQESYFKNKFLIDALIDADTILLAQMKILECQAQRWLHPVVATYIFLWRKNLTKNTMDLIFETQTKKFCYRVNPSGWQLLHDVQEINLPMKNRLITIVCTNPMLENDFLNEELLLHCVNKTSGKINTNIQVVLERFLLNELDENFFLKFINYYKNHYQKELLIKILLAKHKYCGIALIHIAVLYFSEETLVRLLTLISNDIRWVIAKTAAHKTVLDLLYMRDLSYDSGLLCNFFSGLNNDFFDIAFIEFNASKLFLHNIARYSFLAVFSVVIEKTSAKYIDSALLFQNKNGDTPLHLIAQKVSDIFYFEKLIWHLIGLHYMATVKGVFEIENQYGDTPLTIMGQDKLNQCSKLFKTLFFTQSQKRKCEDGEEGAPSSKRVKQEDVAEEGESPEKILFTPSNKL